MNTFSIGATDFLLNDAPLQIRCGELHFARVPRPYWRHRLQMIRAMGFNAVCAYLFWNFHEPRPGEFRWDAAADAAEFCRLAQEENLWVVLRPGPYVCAEWDGGGLPAWLLKRPDIQLRTRDEKFIGPSRRWLNEVGRVLGPLQITRGGPILMVQVENEYGSFGTDTEYMGALRQATLDAGFEVPLFACNPPGDLKNGWRDDLFQLVNFGSDPQSGFASLRQLQPNGPLMCGEFYPGWFDTWGAPHHLGNAPRYLEDLKYMLEVGGSFSMYMAHGGTSFGLWPGADRPFKPDTSSYDYDAPISEAGHARESFALSRELMRKYLRPGETLPAAPPENPLIEVPQFELRQSARVFDNLPSPIEDSTPRHMEAYDQFQGCIVYRTTLPAGAQTALQVLAAHDFAWVHLDGEPLGVMDRRSRRYSVPIPARERAMTLDILVETMGHVNFGQEVHDRKGLHGVTIEGVTLADWQIFPLPLDATQLENLQWRDEPGRGANFWRGSFEIERAADTFFDLTNWGKGVVWVNGICLSRFWNIGPTQSAYVPAPYLRDGRNEVVILDLLGPTAPTLRGMSEPILDVLRPELDFSAPDKTARLALENLTPVFAGELEAATPSQEIRFAQPVAGRQFALEILSAHDGGPSAALAEIGLLDENGEALRRNAWTICFASSEESAQEDGLASNIINGQSASFWQARWSENPSSHPHYLALDLGAPQQIGGFTYRPRQGANRAGAVKNYRVYVGDELVKNVAD